MWPSNQLLDGYVMKSDDVVGRYIGELPRILGMHPAYLKDIGAVYGIRVLSPQLLSSITGPGFNNDREEGNAESFDRPPLWVGNANVLRDANAVAEIEALYLSGGMLVKLKFDFRSAASSRKPLLIPNDPKSRYPIGAGIREYILHRQISFTLISAFSTSDINARIPAL